MAIRELIFRGKRVDNGEWVEGHNILYVQDGRVFIIPTGTKIDSYRDEDGALFMATFYYEVIPETVGQYTGLTDKNGKKIFEGDVIKEEYEVFVSARKKEKRAKIGYVEYESSCLCCGYYAYFWNDKEKWRGNFYIHPHCEVNGNIHDNPELLEVHND